MAGCRGTLRGVIIFSLVISDFPILRDSTPVRRLRVCVVLCSTFQPGGQLAVAGSVGFGPRAGSLRGGVIGLGARILWRHVTPNSVRRGDVSRLVGVTKPFPRWGWRFWGIGILRFGSVTVTSYRAMTARLCSENLSQEKTPQVCGCVEPSALQLSFVLEYRDIGPTGMNVVVVK